MIAKKLVGTALIAASMMLFASSSYAGLGTCNNNETCEVGLGENCLSCPGDCGVCCGNAVCDAFAGESCLNCPLDCGACPVPTTTLPSTPTTLPPIPTTTIPSVPTTLPSIPTTTIPSVPTTLPSLPTTTMLPPTTTLPEPITGACCSAQFCTPDVIASSCELGTFHPDGTCPTSCTNCGNGCLEAGEQCDDGGTQNGDGCSSTCQQEPCWSCGAVLGINPRTPVGSCVVSSCSFVGGKGCALCGNGIVESGEDCDPAVTSATDCCGPDCKFDAPGASCSDGVFCNGAETCDGEGDCGSGTPPSCSELDSACAVGECSPQFDQCVADTAAKDGQSCQASGGCVLAGSGICFSGTCTGTGTLLSPSCRWIILGGNPGGPVRVRNGVASTKDASECGDLGRSAGLLDGNFVVTATSGEGIRFDADAEVSGDIATDGASVGTSLYGDVPGTFPPLHQVPGGVMQEKNPPGTRVDTTGSHPLVEVCSDDQDIIAAAVTTLDNKPATGNQGSLRVRPGASQQIDVTGQGVAVIDVTTLNVGRRATLRLTGGANDVVMIRVVNGRFKLGFGSSVVLDGGLIPEHVLFYNKQLRCRIAPRVEGQGTVFSPNAIRFQLGAGTKWKGTFLGGAKEIRVRLRAELTHVPFTGF